MSGRVNAAQVLRLVHGREGEPVSATLITAEITPWPKTKQYLLYSPQRPTTPGRRCHSGRRQVIFHQATASDR